MIPAPPENFRCHAQNREGERCKNWARDGAEFCAAHDPVDPWRPEKPPEEYRCTATATGGTTRPERKGERCEHWAMKGQTVCRSHGGGAPQNRVAARRRITEAKLEDQAARLVGTAVANPLTELAALAGRARAWMEMMQDRVEHLLDVAEAEATPPAGADGPKPEGSGIRYRSGAGEQLRAEVQLYERSMDRLGKFLADFGRLNIDERLSKIEEAKADVVLRAIDAALAHAGVTGAQATDAKRVAARHLRAA